jgi:FtsP/CotA-like multicopper oxidase with cupredoxin domain
VRVWSGAPYRVLAVDATDVHEPGQVHGQALTVTAGGRADLDVVVPRDGVRVQVGTSSALVVGPAGAVVPPVPEPAPDREVDLLSYGTPAPLGFDPDRADRRFDYSIGRRPGFVDGKPGLWWSVNGHLYPDMPMAVVREGDVARFRIENHSGDVHPMHLHGHHAVVLSRDGVRATGSPWWFDSLNVRDGETYEVAFVADNPGIWMDHCHNLKHAAEGLVTHLMYEGITEPFRVGGDHDNEPE